MDILNFNKIYLKQNSLFYGCNFCLLYLAQCLFYNFNQKQFRLLSEPLKIIYRYKNRPKFCIYKILLFSKYFLLNKIVASESEDFSTKISEKPVSISDKKYQVGSREFKRSHQTPGLSSRGLSPMPDTYGFVNQGT